MSLKRDGSVRPVRRTTQPSFEYFLNQIKSNAQLVESGPFFLALVIGYINKLSRRVSTFGVT